MVGADRGDYPEPDYRVDGTTPKSMGVELLPAALQVACHLAPGPDDGRCRADDGDMQKEAMPSEAGTGTRRTGGYIGRLHRILIPPSALGICSMPVIAGVEATPPATGKEPAQLVRGSGGHPMRRGMDPARVSGPRRCVLRRAA